MTREEKIKCPWCSIEIIVKDVDGISECLSCGNVFVNEETEDFMERKLQTKEFNQFMDEIGKEINKVDEILSHDAFISFFLEPRARKLFHFPLSPVRKFSRVARENDPVLIKGNFTEEDETWKILEIIFSLSGLEPPSSFVDASGNFDMTLASSKVKPDSIEFFHEKISGIPLDDIETLFKKIKTKVSDPLNNSLKPTSELKNITPPMLYKFPKRR